MNNQELKKDINISLKDMEDIKCSECESKVFNQSFLLRKISRFATGQTQDGIASLPVFVCAKCGNINKEFLP